MIYWTINPDHYIYCRRGMSKSGMLLRFFFKNYKYFVKVKMDNCFLLKNSVSFRGLMNNEKRLDHGGIFI